MPVSNFVSRRLGITKESDVWKGLLTLTWPELGYQLDVIRATRGSYVETD